VVPGSGAVAFNRERFGGASTKTRSIARQKSSRSRR